jgi:hypothetical protein
MSESQTRRADSQARLAPAQAERRQAHIAAADFWSCTANTDLSTEAAAHGAVQDVRKPPTSTRGEEKQTGETPRHPASLRAG